jgi:4-alpha-glucanotransferase
MERARRELRRELGFLQFQQYLFDKQWRELRVICAGLGIGLIGDIPIFVAHDSADVWQHRDIFRLDEEGMPTVVAGVPPDYFSKTGQRWGNPLYRWARMKKGGYAWWIQRLGDHALPLRRGEARPFHWLSALLRDPRERADGRDRPLDEGAEL